MIWCETSEPNMEDARRFAEVIRRAYPGKMLAYNCSPSFHWNQKLDSRRIARFQAELGEMGYKFQFVTLAGFHALNLSMFELASEYARSGMSAYARLQEREFALAQTTGYSAVRHQRFVGAGYFDTVQTIVSGGESETVALEGSTEDAQFMAAAPHMAAGAANTEPGK
jgi:isocitrate lyase